MKEREIEHYLWACMMLAIAITAVGHSLYTGLLALAQMLCLIIALFKLNHKKK